MAHYEIKTVVEKYAEEVFEKPIKKTHYNNNFARLREMPAFKRMMEGCEQIMRDYRADNPFKTDQSKKETEIKKIGLLDHQVDPDVSKKVGKEGPAFIAETIPAQNLENTLGVESFYGNEIKKIKLGSSSPDGKDIVSTGYDSVMSVEEHTGSPNSLHINDHSSFDNKRSLSDLGKGSKIKKISQAAWPCVGFIPKRGGINKKAKEMSILKQSVSTRKSLASSDVPTNDITRVASSTAKGDKKTQFEEPKL